MSNKDDLLKRWLNQRDATAGEIPQIEAHVNASRKHNPPQNTTPNPVTENPSPEDAQNDQVAPDKPLASPLLTGKLAEFLKQKSPRKLSDTPYKYTSTNAPWMPADIQTRAAVTAALILTSHITRFAHSTLSIPHLNKARDALLRGFNANDAVQLEIEAYELMQWFATAIDESWNPVDKTTAEPVSELTETTLMQTITHAIEQKTDLQMKYYTGSRGEFSERRITPIEITAEKYLVAFCHLRQEERVFRLSRIVRLCPLSSDPDAQPAPCYPNPASTALPPLPQTPTIEIRAAKATKRTPQKETAPHKSRKSTEKKAAQNTKSAIPTDNDPKSEKSTPQKRKKTAQKKQMPSLFDFSPAQKPQSNPSKKAHQPKLPGFDND